MKEEIKSNAKPYEQAYFPPKPNGFTKFMRTCVIWQFIRFLVINIKMVQVILKSH
jgi:hypothetical protein